MTGGSYETQNTIPATGICSSVAWADGCRLGNNKVAALVVAGKDAPIAHVAGDTVVAGETVIATVGNTWRNSGSHLHLEIRRNGQYINPIYAVEFERTE